MKEGVQVYRRDFDNQRRRQITEETSTINIVQHKEYTKKEGQIVK